MKIFRNSIILVIIVLAIPQYGVAAQQGLYCFAHSINGMSWSPSGDRLAVMTLHDVVIYDSDLNLIRSIEAPKVIYDVAQHVGPVWSPDGEWIVLPERTTPELAPSGYGGWTIANTRTGELRMMIPPYGFSERGGYFVEDIAWSPDNRFILILKHGSELGLNYPLSELVIVLGAWDVGFSPVAEVYDNLIIHDISWDAHGITARTDGLILGFDSDLQLIPEATTPRPIWWVSNPSGTREATQRRPEFTFVVHENNTEQVTTLSGLVNNDGEIIGFGYVSEIIWFADNIRLFAIYDHTLFEENHPELASTLQGIIYNAETGHTDSLMLQADGDIEGYAIAGSGERIALYRDDTVIELWNPLAQERLTTITVPSLPIADTC